MKKAILISIRPEGVKEILNGEKTIEIRKTMPKCGLPIDVYIYCSHGKRGLYVPTIIEKPFAILDTGFVWLSKDEHVQKAIKPIDGKVVAKFTLCKIENFINGMNELEREWDGKPDAEYDYFAYEKALEKACLTYEEADKYCPDQSFYAWHISDLEIFDEPKKLSEFGRLLDRGTYSKADYLKDAIRECRNEVTAQQEKLMAEMFFSINEAPKSWQYVEVKE